MREAIERFAEKVAYTEDGCLLWLHGTLGRAPDHLYGIFWFNGRNVCANRWLWEQANGPIPPGHMLDHFRDCTTLCCLPDHLRPVTARENTLRSNGSVSALNAAKTHCPRGHEYTPDNTRTYRGMRHCRACNRIRYHNTRGHTMTTPLPEQVPEQTYQPALSDQLLDRELPDVTPAPPGVPLDPSTPDSPPDETQVIDVEPTA